MASEAGKGDIRRKEDTKRVEANLDKMDWSKRDRSKDTFKVRVNGKLVERKR